MIIENNEECQKFHQYIHINSEWKVSQKVALDFGISFKGGICTRLFQYMDAENIKK